jgi:hypothetical protein
LEKLLQPPLVHFCQIRYIRRAVGNKYHAGKRTLEKLSMKFSSAESDMGLLGIAERHGTNGACVESSDFFPFMGSLSKQIQSCTEMFNFSLLL